MSHNEWDEYADMWDSVAFEYADKAYAELIKIVDLKNLHVLDFGCGTGLLTERMITSCRDIVALDSSKKMTSVLENKNLSNVEVFSELLTSELIETEPNIQAKFDLIVASSVCGFIPNYEDTLSLLHSMLKPGGYFVQWDWLKRDETAENGFTENEVEQAFSNVGFTNSLLSVPFVMNSGESDMPVLMVWGQK